MNMGNLFSLICLLFFIALGLVIWIGILLRFCRNRYGTIHRVPAVLIDKQTYHQESLSHTGLRRLRPRYLLTFLAEQKRLSFYVSPDTFETYSLKQKGTLCYRGSKMLDFS